LGVIRDELALAGRGEPRVVLTGGEAGIGKSRLIEEAMRLATGAGWQTLLGRCADERGLPPYLPWIDATTHHTPPTATRPAPPSDIDPTAVARELVRLRRILTAGGSEPETDRRSASPEQRALQRNQAVAVALGRLERIHPLLVAFDDLQWSDAASNELLRSVMIHGPAAPLLVLAAYRSEEAHVNPALAHTITEFQLHRPRRHAGPHPRRRRLPRPGWQGRGEVRLRERVIRRAPHGASQSAPPRSRQRPGADGIAASRRRPGARYRCRGRQVGTAPGWSDCRLRFVPKRPLPHMLALLPPDDRDRANGEHPRR